MENKILYRSEDACGTIVDYYVEPIPGENEVRWFLYPRLPEGMHWKAGDAIGGLGVMHDDTRQSFANFKLNPSRIISDQIKEKVIQAMEGK